MFDNGRRERRLMTPEKKLRRLTVTNRSQHGAFVPQVRMTGRWLARAGFPAGCRLAVAVEHGRLVVTVTARPRPLPCRRTR
jgi:hypothetical protein